MTFTNGKAVQITQKDIKRIERKRKKNHKSKPKSFRDSCRKTQQKNHIHMDSK